MKDKNEQLKEVLKDCLIESEYDTPHEDNMIKKHISKPPKFIHVVTILIAIIVLIDSIYAAHVGVNQYEGFLRQGSYITTRDSGEHGGGFFGKDKYKGTIYGMDAFFEINFTLPHLIAIAVCIWLEIVNAQIVDFKERQSEGRVNSKDDSEMVAWSLLIAVFLAFGVFILNFI